MKPVLQTSLHSRAESCPNDMSIKRRLPIAPSTGGPVVKLQGDTARQAQALGKGPSFQNAESSKVTQAADRGMSGLTVR